MDATELNIQPEDMVALKQLMQRAGFEQHDFDHLVSRTSTALIGDVRKLITGECQAKTAEYEVFVQGEKTTVFRLGNNLWHNGRELTVLRCSELKGVNTYADLTGYFIAEGAMAEAHPPEELLDFLAANAYMIPGDWNLRGERESWVIFLSTRSNDGSVHGLYAGRDGISREHWGAGDEDGFEKSDHIVVYKDTL
jgi:hypothetical protein